MWQNFKLAKPHVKF